MTARVALALALFPGTLEAGARDAPPGVTGKPVTPDISAVAGALTSNGTWAALAGHVGFWGGDRWRYKGAAGWISPRLDFYDAKGMAFGFNLDGLVVFQELLRRVGRTDLFLGGRFLFLDSTTRFENDTLPPDFPSLEFKSRDSGLGLTVRAQTARGDVPFYALPFIRLRGVPVMRYQGESAVSAEGEVRFGLTKRWWLVGFGGSGWTDAGTSRIVKDETVVAGGLGFRYLIARLLGLQMGLDVARGPEEWAIYVVFGSSW